MSLPDRLKNDAIVEALVEIRFEQTAQTAELVLGKLAARTEWAALRQQRLPLADFPAPIRQGDPNLRFQPIMELVAPQGDMAVKLGDSVIALHVYRPYCGWTVFSERANGIVEHLFSTLPSAVVRRIGLRYINAFVPKLHHIRGVADLHLEIMVAGQKVQNDFNLNYKVAYDDSTMAMVRIAAPKFVQGTLPAEASAFVDVDVFTPEDFKSDSKDKIRGWIDAAHEFEKVQFFKLLSESQIKGMDS